MPALRLTGYTVLVDAGAFDRLGELVREAVPAFRYVLISDTTVAELHGDRIRTALGADRTLTLTVPPGEQEKTREQWAALSDAMFAHGVGRDAAVVALGGGVVGDLAGFVAATFMRGLPWINLPTTLLAMVDSCIGGKTAVDTPHGKNLIGAFHRPALVAIDPEVLATLPRDHLAAGFAEVLKHGVIRDAAYFDCASSSAPALISAPDAHAFVPLIERSIAIKGEIIERDERERGERQVLNFGHTIGHAIEQSSGFRVPHGHAVGLGMIIESRCGELLGITAPGTSALIEAAIRGAELPVVLPRDLAADALLGASAADKKARRGAPRYALPERIGAMAVADHGWTFEVPAALVRQALG